MTHSLLKAAWTLETPFMACRISPASSGHSKDGSLWGDSIETIRGFLLTHGLTSARPVQPKALFVFSLTFCSRMHILSWGRSSAQQSLPTRKKYTMPITGSSVSHISLFRLEFIIHQLCVYIRHFDSRISWNRTRKWTLCRSPAHGWMSSTLTTGRVPGFSAQGQPRRYSILALWCHSCCWTRTYWIRGFGW